MMSRPEDQIRHYRRLGFVLATITFLCFVAILVCVWGRVYLGGWGVILGYGTFAMGIGTAGCWLKYRDLHRRRLRGHSNDCRKCGYNLTGNVSGTCPECGQEIGNRAAFPGTRPPVPVGALPLARHLACPECGYDLHGIPDVRCPECGFHYDAKALLAMATYAELSRLAAARIVIARAMVAAALAVPAGCLSVGFRGWGTVFLLAVCFLGAFGTWAAYTNRYDGLESIPGLSIPCCGTVVFYSLGLSIFPLGLLIFSASVLLTVWVIRLRHCPAPPPPSNVRYADLHRSAQRQCLVGDILLAAATLLVLAVSLHVT